jgi:hypothetical protein
MRPQVIILKSVKIKMLLRQSISFEDNDDTQLNTLLAHANRANGASCSGASQRKPGEEEIAKDAPEACPLCGSSPSTWATPLTVAGLINAVVLLGLGVALVSRRQAILGGS